MMKLSKILVFFLFAFVSCSAFAQEYFEYQKGEKIVYQIATNRLIVKAKNDIDIKANSVFVRAKNSIKSVNGGGTQK